MAVVNEWDIGIVLGIMSGAGKGGMLESTKPCCEGSCEPVIHVPVTVETEICYL